MIRLFNLLLALTLTLRMVAAEVQLAWAPNPPSENVVAYEVAWGDVASPTTNVVEVTAPQTSVTVTGLTPETMVYFTVTAINERGDRSPESISIAYRVPNELLHPLSVPEGSTHSIILQSATSPGGEWETIGVFFGPPDPSRFYRLKLVTP